MTTRIQIPPATTRRLGLGAALGALFGLLAGWAIAGGWNSVYLEGVPTDLNLYAIRVSAVQGGVLGAMCGMAFAWPSSISTASGVITVGLAMVLPLGLGLLSEVARIPPNLPEWAPDSPLILIPLLVLIRASILLADRVATRSAKAKVAALVLPFVLVTSTLLATSWAIDSVSEAFLRRRTMLREVYALSTSNGWHVDRLEVEGNLMLKSLRHPSGVHVYLADGRTLFCSYPLYGEGPLCPPDQPPTPIPTLEPTIAPERMTDSELANHLVCHEADIRGVLCVRRSPTRHFGTVSLVSTGRIAHVPLEPAAGTSSLGDLAVLEAITRSAQGDPVPILLLLQVELSSRPAMNSFPSTYGLIYLLDHSGPPGEIKGSGLIRSDTEWATLFPRGSQWEFHVSSPLYEELRLDGSMLQTKAYDRKLRCFIETNARDCRSEIVLVPVAITDVERFP